jgi:hypothetical protein
VDDRFGEAPLDAQVAAVCRVLDLDPRLARRWRELPDPPDEALSDPEEEPAWRGSG